ncbi:hypothetical protein COF68_05905 [Bacillus toyonensis]|uniref:hypothetical protein n=1 Tax=Bacillus toyonensis TaxID=155322 RepID=UPI000BFD5FFA|nr:hypothetical protein [Bacillus toyonensis]PHE64370.1 hypothetical protein COF68_05905 [Bacillus toyonensis]
MRVILILGSKSATNASRLREQDDSIDIEPYENVQDMIDGTLLRNLSFERVVISTASFKKREAMEQLCEYLRERHQRATVVFMFQQGKGEDLAKTFNEVFNSPLYTDMSIETNGIQLLVESAVGDIDTIRDKYSNHKYVVGEEDMIEDSYDDVEVEVKTEDKLEAEPQPMFVLPQRKRYAKRYGFFGLKKLSKQQLQTISYNQQLISSYMQHLLSNGNVEGESGSLESVQLAQQEVTDEYNNVSTDGYNHGNNNQVHEEYNQNQGNLNPSPVFTELQLGFYGFATNFNDKPMLLRVGTNVRQVHNK